MNFSWSFSCSIWRRTAARLRPLATIAAVAWLSGCASTINTRVTTFNQWPSNIAGSTFSFITRTGPGELEQATYQSYAQAELEGRGFKRAAPDKTGRLQVELTTGNRSEQQTSVQPVYQDSPVFLPPYRDAAGRYYPGVWTLDPWGPRYVGDRVVNTTIQISNLQVRMLDAEGSPPGKSRTVFESRAIYEGRGSNDNLPVIVPYLVRAVFEDFPGTSGQVRVVRFDAKTGAIVKDR